MDTKNVKNAHFWQVDHKIKNILKVKGVLILPSEEAWQKFKWSRPFFEKRPKEGYFIWVKKKIDFPLLSCVTITSPKVSQDLTNLLVIEKGIKVKANVICNATRNNLCARHKAQGKIFLKKEASLEYKQFHQWGQNDFVNPDYEFILENDSRLIYTYKNLSPPKSLKMKTIINSKENASSNLNVVINGLNSNIEIKDVVNLLGKNSQGIVKLRLVGRKNSKIKAVSEILAKNSGKGHLDCQGLVVGKRVQISLVPQLICKNKEAQLTHEASIGKISNEQLNYLRMRGLTEKEAIDLIVAGFLKL